MATAVRRNPAPDLKKRPNLLEDMQFVERGNDGLAAAEPYWGSSYENLLRRK